MQKKQQHLKYFTLPPHRKSNFEIQHKTGIIACLGFVGGLNVALTHKTRSYLEAESEREEREGK